MIKMEGPSSKNEGNGSALPIEERDERRVQGGRSETNNIMNGQQNHVAYDDPEPQNPLPRMLWAQDLRSQETMTLEEFLAIARYMYRQISSFPDHFDGQPMQNHRNDQSPPPHENLENHHRESPPRS
ncbi:hypothetical protein Dimus_009381 [Dionaea muscipula]